MVSISVCMIVKNEEAVLERCLNSLSGLYEELIIVDTGSTDKTKKIAAKYTDKIYDFTWVNDFSAARNFSFSLATKDYIYAADADEELDEINRDRFMALKEVMDPEVEIVQMKYVNVGDYNTVLNTKKELRAKLFKRERSFVWIDPVHETVRTNPLVFDSDIEILHKPVSMHSGRDFSTFLKAFKEYGTLSKRLIKMYAKELLIAGEKDDFEAAEEVFKSVYPTADPDSRKYISCVLARIARHKDDMPEFIKLTLKDMLTTPSSEMCVELGEYYFELCDYEEAVLWYYNAVYEASSILDIRTSGIIPLARLCNCYDELVNETVDDELRLQYKENADTYRRYAANWEIPEE